MQQHTMIMQEYLATSILTYATSHELNTVEIELAA